MDIFVPSLIRRKRNGGELTSDEIGELIRRYTGDLLPDYQMSALLMAVLFRGLSEEELTAWTDAMLHSGSVLELDHIAGVKVDKHSTGGVGDKISICLAPAVAAAGVPVPMISGRGLGHTGGTLDKLESIPGFRVDLDIEKSVDLLARFGLFLIGQTEQLAPADRRIYALRDVTGTVESVPLISSSIMSKKLAEGIGGLVLDVKVGRGAFMKDLESARELAHTLIGIGRRAGVRVDALLTDMEAPIGRFVGNALEVREAIEVLRGRGPADTVELTVELGAQMLVTGEISRDLAGGRSEMKRVLTDGSGLERFAQIVEAQGGDPRICDDDNVLPKASRMTEVLAPVAGTVRIIDPIRVAQAALEVGAGRRVKEDVIDPATGVELFVEVGEKVSSGQVLAVLHHNGSGESRSIAELDGAFEITEGEIPIRQLVIERI